MVTASRTASLTRTPLLQSCQLFLLCVQPHPASAAAAAVLVAHASSLGPGIGNANTKYNTDGSSFTGSHDDMERGMGVKGQGPLGQGIGVIATGPVIRQQTMGPVSPHLAVHAD